MFYDRFVQLCTERGLKPSRAAIEAGLSKSTVTKWKSTPDADPTGAAIKKLTEYFGITIAELMGEEKKNAPAEGGKGDELDDVDMAFYGTFKVLNEASKETIRTMARVLLEQQDKDN